LIFGLRTPSVLDRQKAGAAFKAPHLARDALGNLARALRHGHGVLSHDGRLLLYEVSRALRERLRLVRHGLGDLLDALRARGAQPLTPARRSRHTASKRQRQHQEQHRFSELKEGEKQVTPILMPSMPTRSATSKPTPINVSCWEAAAVASALSEESVNTAF